MPPLLRLAGRSLVHSLGAALALCLVFALLSVLAATRDPREAAAQLRPVIADQSLFGSMSLPLGGRVVPSWEGNDCLVFMMLVLPRQDFWRDAFSPRIPEQLGPQAAGEPVQARCERLAELLSVDPDPPTQHYDRYLHGQRVLAALVLPWAGPDLMRLGLTTALAVTLASLAVWAGWRSWRGPAEAISRRDAAFAWFALCLLLFHGPPMFGRYWTHALSDLAPAFLLWALYLMPRWDAAPRMAVLGALGCAVSIFEFLTGQLPLSVALILLAAAALPAPQQKTRVAIDLAAFTAGAILPFAIKMALGALLFADIAAGEAGGSLLHRVFGPVVAEMSAREIEKVAALGFDVARLDEAPWWRLPYTAARILYFAFVLGAGAWWLGLGGASAWWLGFVLLAGSAGTIAWCLSGAGRGGWASPRAVLALGACCAILGWYVLFLNHTLLHTAWMVRAMVVFPMAAGVLLLYRPAGRAA